MDKSPKNMQPGTCCTPRAHNVRSGTHLVAVPIKRALSTIHVAIHLQVTNYIED